MKNSKKILSGMLALTMMASLTACGGGNNSDSGNANGGADTTAPADTTEATTTTTMGVDINTETLKADEQAVIEAAAEKLPDAELENKEIKWLSTWDINPDTSGKSKPLELELFETKYNGTIKWYPTQWGTRYSDLSNYVLGGEGIDFFPSNDGDAFPTGAMSGMFQSVDDYMDYDSELWAPIKAANDQLALNGKHYMMVTDVTADAVVIYNRKTIEDYGLEDPAELFAAGNWTWDTFKQLLLDYCNPDEDRHGIDGYWAEKCLMLTTGVPCIGIKDGQLVSNINDPNMERVMNFMYDLYQNNLVLNKEPFGWSEQPAFLGEGKELFYPCGLWALYGAPEIWTAKFGTEEEVMFVPMPKDPEADNYYLSAGMDVFVMCKGAANPTGVARFMDCKRVAATDEGVMQLGEDKLRNDYGWTDEMVEMSKTAKELTAANPVFELYTGVNADLSGIVDSGENGIRSAMRGIDWATTRETIADFVQGQIDDANAKINALS